MKICFSEYEIPEIQAMSVQEARNIMRSSWCRSPWRVLALAGMIIIGAVLLGRLGLSDSWFLIGLLVNGFAAKVTAVALLRFKIRQQMNGGGK